MSKALSSIKDSAEKRKVINRRLQEKQGGLGYWAAVDAQKYYKGSSKGEN